VDASLFGAHFLSYPKCYTLALGGPAAKEKTRSPDEKHAKQSRLRLGSKLPDMPSAVSVEQMISYLEDNIQLRDFGPIWRLRQIIVGGFDVGWGFQSGLMLRADPVTPKDNGLQTPS
jgi:hypothetical protein